MSDLMNFDDFSLADNPDPRCPVILLLDASSSMVERRPGEDHSPLDALNSGLDVLISELHKDPLTKKRVELSVIPYGTHVAEPTPFATVADVTLPILEPMGVTSTGAAVNKALDILEERKKSYKANGVNYYRPWVLLVSDGLATDDTSEAVKRVRALEDRGGVAFFAVGVDGADLNELSKFSKNGALALSGIKFDELFEWVSASQAAVSASTPGDRVDLPVPSGWMSV